MLCVVNSTIYKRKCKNIRSLSVTFLRKSIKLRCVAFFQIFISPDCHLNFVKLGTSFSRILQAGASLVAPLFIWQTIFLTRQRDTRKAKKEFHDKKLSLLLKPTDRKSAYLPFGYTRCLFQRQFWRYTQYRDNFSVCLKEDLSVTKSWKSSFNVLEAGASLVNPLFNWQTIILARQKMEKEHGESKERIPWQKFFFTFKTHRHKMRLFTFGLHTVFISASILAL